MWRSVDREHSPPHRGFSAKTVIGSERVKKHSRAKGTFKRPGYSNKGLIIQYS